MNFAVWVIDLKRNLISIIIVSLFVCLVCCDSLEPNNTLSIEINTDKTAYSISDSVLIKLFVQNNTNDSLHVVSYYTEPFNIRISHNSRIVWDRDRYIESLNDYSFMLFPIRLDPRERKSIYEMVWDQKDLDDRKTGKGEYLISGELRLNEPEHCFYAYRSLEIK